MNEALLVIFTAGFIFGFFVSGVCVAIARFLVQSIPVLRYWDDWSKYKFLLEDDTII